MIRAIDIQPKGPFSKDAMNAYLKVAASLSRARLPLGTLSLLVACLSTAEIPSSWLFLLVKSCVAA